MFPERAACRKVPNKTEILHVSGKFHKVFGTLTMIARVQLLSLANDVSLPESYCKKGKEKKSIYVFS